MPKYLYDSFKFMSDVRLRNTRAHPLTLSVPLTYNKTFIGFASQLWNKLPADLMSLSKPSAFKKKSLQFNLK